MSDPSSRADMGAVLAVVRMTHHEPALRAAYLVLRERSESTIAEVLAQRLAMPPDALDIRMHAATINAILLVTADHLADATEGFTDATLDQYRERIADALRRAMHGLPGGQ